MYHGYYGLSRPPFAVTPDPSLIYMSPAHREALATLIYGIETRKGFIVCTGEVGTGKTTVVRAFFDQADPDRIKIIYIFTPQISPMEMTRFICTEIGLAEPSSVFDGGQQLQLKLLDLYEQGRTVVLLIDEAQLLPPDTLELLRLLSNFETDAEKLIQIVLVGQPEVDEMLARREMRQVNQRVALRARLGPLSEKESLEYIAHRLTATGAPVCERVLSPDAARAIAEAADGIPRRINILADNVLIAGFGLDQQPVGGPLARRTIGEFMARSTSERARQPTRLSHLYKRGPSGTGLPPGSVRSLFRPPMRIGLAATAASTVVVLTVWGVASGSFGGLAFWSHAEGELGGGSDSGSSSADAGSSQSPPMVTDQPIAPASAVPSSLPALPLALPVPPDRSEPALATEAAPLPRVPNLPEPSAAGLPSSSPPPSPPPPARSLPSAVPSAPPGGRQDIIEAQWLLARLGEYAGPLDGRDSPRFDAALQRHFASSWDPGRPFTAALVNPALLDSLHRAVGH